MRSAVAPERQNALVLEAVLVPAAAALIGSA
jgi:hypothetical protein